jgi:hypothetical protein
MKTYVYEILNLKAVLRIQDVYPGSQIRIQPFLGIPDPTVFYPGFQIWIPDPGPTIKRREKLN